MTGSTGISISIPNTSARSAAATVFRPPLFRAVRAAQQCRVSGLADHFQVIHLAQVKQEIGLGVEAGADAVEDCGHVFAHVGAVGAGAVHGDFMGRWGTGRRRDALPSA